MRRWASAADALGLTLDVSLRDDPSPRTSDRVLTAALIEDLATPGGWEVTGHDPWIVVLDRVDRQERLLVLLCDLPVEILDAADARCFVRTQTVAQPPPEWRLGVLVVVRAELRDRYRDGLDG